MLADSLLQRLGSPSQIEVVLQPMLEGHTSLALAYAERQSRYQLADCRTRAEWTSGGWTLDGEQVWVLNGHAADQVLVVARTTGGPHDTARLSIFIVAGEAPGLTRIPIKTMDGLNVAVIIPFAHACLNGMNSVLSCRASCHSARTSFQPLAFSPPYHVLV